MSTDSHWTHYSNWHYLVVQAFCTFTTISNIFKINIQQIMLPSVIALSAFTLPPTSPTIYRICMVVVMVWTIICVYIVATYSQPVPSLSQHAPGNVLVAWQKRNGHLSFCFLLNTFWHVISSWFSSIWECLWCNCGMWISNDEIFICNSLFDNSSIALYSNLTIASVIMFQ